MRRPLRPPEFRSWSMSDGYVLRGRWWPATTPLPGVGVLYLHGIQSHGGWFEGSAGRLAATCPVLLPDRRGSGLNEPARGDTPAATRWLADLDELAEWMQREHAIHRLGVVGVSWGGKLAALWAARHPRRVTHLLLIAPGLFPRVDIGWRARLRVAWSLCGQPSRPFPIPLNDPALFTDNPAGRQFIVDDPLKLTHATARFLWSSSRLDRWLGRLPPGVLAAETTLLLAERDRIIRNAPTVAWLTVRCARQPTVVTLPAAAHTLEFEADPTAQDRLLDEWAQRLTARRRHAGATNGG